MFRIGDFSRIARVSTRLLRFYDEIGLLEPAHADAQSGYRYYTMAQLSQLNRITVLKDLGFSLDQVGDILRSQVSAGELRSMLLVRRKDVERTLALEARRLRQIETRIAQIETEGQLSAEDVSCVPNRPARCSRCGARWLRSPRHSRRSERSGSGRVRCCRGAMAPSSWWWPMRRSSSRTSWT